MGGDDQVKEVTGKEVTAGQRGVAESEMTGELAYCCNTEFYDISHLKISQTIFCFQVYSSHNIISAPGARCPSINFFNRHILLNFQHFKMSLAGLNAMGCCNTRNYCQKIE